MEVIEKLIDEETAKAIDDCAKAAAQLSKALEHFKAAHDRVTFILDGKAKSE